MMGPSMVDWVDGSGGVAGFFRGGGGNEEAFDGNCVVVDHGRRLKFGGEKVANVKLLDETKTPGLVEWAKTFCSNDAVKDVIPETQKLMETVKMIQALAKASLK
ncbi:hypothetical protein RJ640_012671 [Escallonia rubra]|uniref:Uncharacterized protein n=1 Tax=Escallonia rubra TaxID=112253 RepID=A0AA88RWJ2_9ASTE|nr:hypothetical protein RJ640_012671 [Escallonia rubra]